MRLCMLFGKLRTTTTTMTNHCVPDFEMDEEDFSIPISSGLITPRKSALMADGEDEVMELLWQNGQLVVQTQGQTSLKESQVCGPVEQRRFSLTGREISSEYETAQPVHHVYMQKEEMDSCLHYSLDDPDLYADFLFPLPSSAPSYCRHHRPPVPPSSAVATRRSPVNPESGPSNSSRTAIHEQTIVDSNETPMMGSTSRVSDVADSTGNVSGWKQRGTISCTPAAATTCEPPLTSSPSSSGTSVSASEEQPKKPIRPTKTTVPDRKRKGRETDDSLCRSEDAEFKSTDAKKQVRGSTSTGRSRAAEVHNLSERRRRDRINEKMRTLQELIPNCNKSDKASMLDEAIEYLKSLQLQVQMMSMGCGMVPIMFHGIQQYMPPVGMGMSMGMGMNRPIVSFPSVLPGSSLPTPAIASHLGPRFSMLQIADPSRNQVTSQSDDIINPLVSQNSIQSQMQRFADPFQQYHSLHQIQVPLPQNQAVMWPITSQVAAEK